MACFIVPLTQAIATSAYRKHMERTQAVSAQNQKTAPLSVERQETFLTRNLPALEKMLWGGSLMLIVDHILSGELTWMFPFFTALESEGGGAQILWEMLTVGVPMSLLVTAVWAAWCFAYKLRVERS